MRNADEESRRGSSLSLPRTPLTEPTGTPMQHAFFGGKILGIRLVRRAGIERSVGVDLQPVHLAKGYIKQPN